MADIFKEVEEEVRRDKALELWRKFGPLAIGVAAVVVVGVAGYKGWTYFQQRQIEEQSNSFAQAIELLDAGETEQASAALAELSDPNGSGYPLLAAFEQARLLAEGGDVAGAVEIWDAIALSEPAGAGFRGTATVLSVLHQLEDSDPQALRAKLEPLSGQGEVFRPSALELLAELALREGDKQEAIRLYQELADELSAPPGMRARAAQMLEALKD
ncbi:MAG: tetratricopeptide repeat protein [Kiloniellales bacterium]|nr:tetratricopeptide repeat protein [Kiloniellales bacterium]